MTLDRSRNHVPREEVNGCAQALSSALCHLIRERALGLNGTPSASDEPIVSAFIESVFASLPIQFSSQDLLRHILAASEREESIAALPPGESAETIQTLQTISARIGPAMERERCIEEWGETKGREIACFVSNVMLRRADKYYTVGVHFMNAFRYFCPPEVAETILQELDAASDGHLVEKMKEAQILADRVHRFLVEEERLPTKDGEGIHNFSLAAPLETHCLRSSTDSPLLIRVKYRHRTLDSVTIITPLGEMPCFRGADGITVEKAAEALTRLNLGLGYSQLSLSNRERNNCVGLERYCDSPVVLHPSSGRPQDAHFATFPFGDRFDTNDWAAAIPAERQVGATNALGGLSSRQLAHEIRLAARYVTNPSLREHYEGGISNEVFTLACKIHDDRSASTKALIGALFEGQRTSRDAVLLALAARGSETVREVLAYDQVEYTTEDYAELLQIWGIPLPENAVVGPDLEPTTYAAEIKILFSCLGPAGVVTLVNMACGSDDEGQAVDETIQNRAQELISCENPLLLPELLGHLAEFVSMKDRAAAVIALGRMGPILDSHEEVLTETLSALLGWEPAEEDQVVRISAIQECVSLAAELRSPSVALSDQIVEAFCTLVQDSPLSSLEHHVERVFRRVGYAAASHIGRIEEFLNNDAPEEHRDSYRVMIARCTRAMQSTNEGWNEYRTRTQR